MAQRTRIVIETEQVHLLSVCGALDRKGAATAASSLCWCSRTTC
jgi:hypothetical protein